MDYPKFKLAMGQMLVVGGEPKTNLGRATEMIQEAASKECKIIVLPECMDLAWTDPSALEKAQPIPGKYSDTLGRAAIDNNIYVVAGLTERDGDRVYNSAVLISPKGEVLSVHRKINVLGIAQHLYSIGDRLSVTRTPLGTIGLDICADNFRDCLVLSHSLGRMGAQLLLSPSAWAVDADHTEEKGYGKGWRDSYDTLSKLYDMTVVGVSNVGPITAGPWEGRKCIGCSVAYGPGGEQLAQAPYGENAEALVTIDIQAVEPAAKGTQITKMLEERGHKVDILPGWFDSNAKA